MTDRRDIIEMKGEPGDEGRIFYASAPPPGPKGPFGNFLAKAFGVALGVAAFLAILFFFVYIVIPLVVIGILWTVLRGIFRPQR